MEELKLKLVVVGDGNAGKSCLCLSYIDRSRLQAYFAKYEPTVLENTTIQVNFHGTNPLILDVWDTAGQEAYSSIRELSYHGADVFLICYSCSSDASLHNVGPLWVQETIKKHPKSVFVLSGNKADLFDREDESHVSFSDGEKVKKKYGAKAHIRCSAKNLTNTDKIFKKCLEVGYKKKYVGKYSCFLL